MGLGLARISMIYSYSTEIDIVRCEQSRSAINYSILDILCN